MTVETPENVSKTPDVPVTEKITPINSDVKTPSPAQDLRDIQMLLVQGIFPGQVAPAVVKAYSLLEKMAVQIEASSTASQETK
jgi:hypothetical protein